MLFIIVPVYRLDEIGGAVPELPEVETIARELRLRLIGQRLAGIRVSRRRLRSKWSASWVPMITGLGIETVRRRGKWIILDLDGHRHLLFHLGMTGQLCLERAEAPPARHTHWIAQLDRSGQQLR